MTKNLLDQLADEAVPAMPGKVDANLHDRINNLLCAQQVLEVVCCAIPYVFFHYLHALAGAATLTVSGRYAENRNPNSQNPETGEDHAT